MKTTGCPGLDVSLVLFPSLHTESLHLFICFPWCLSGCPSTAFAKKQQRFRSEVTPGSHLIQHSCSRRATYSRFSGAVSSQVLDISEDETSQPLWSTCVKFWSQQKTVLYSGGISRILICSYCLLSCHWAPLRGSWLSSLLTLFRHL